MNEIRGFGEIREVWEKFPAGLLLRDVDGVVLLEERYVDDGEDVDVIHIFDEEITLKDPIDLSMCLETAREYQPDLNVPIYVKTVAASYREDEQKQKERKAYLEATVEKARFSPWNFKLN